MAILPNHFLFVFRFAFFLSIDLIGPPNCAKSAQELAVYTQTVTTKIALFSNEVLAYTRIFSH